MYEVFCYHKSVETDVVASKVEAFFMDAMIEAASFGVRHEDAAMVIIKRKGVIVAVVHSH